MDQSVLQREPQALPRCDARICGQGGERPLPRSLRLALQIASPPIERVLRRFLRQITPFCHEWDEAKELPRALWRKCYEAGWLPGTSRFSRFNL